MEKRRRIRIYMWHFKLMVLGSNRPVTLLHTGTYLYMAAYAGAYKICGRIENMLWYKQKK